MYELCLACVSVFQYLHLEEEGKAEARVEKWLTSPESSQIGTIKMWRKKHRSANFNLKMQEGFREGLLKILKGHRNLWESASKAGRDNLKDFESNLKFPEGPLKSFKDASEREIESRVFNEDFDENQFKTEWAWLRSEKMQ